MAAPTLKPLDVNEPLGTPASEWAQQTFDAIDPNATTGLVTDAHGNPTSDHSASALGGAPGHGVYADKTAGLMQALAADAPKATDPVPLAKPADHSAGVGNGAAPSAGIRVFTDSQGNPTTNENASALEGTPGPPQTPGWMSDPTGSTATTPGAQLPGGWIRSPGSRQTSTLGEPQTSLYEDVSAALGTVGQAAFSALPASVIGNLSNNPEQGGANPAASSNGAPKTGDAKLSSSPPPRSASPGLLSRAQGMLSGLLVRPASPAQKLPAPDAPTTTGEAALVGGGAVASNANELGDKIAAGQDLGGGEPKGVLEGEPSHDIANGAADLEKEGSARRTVSPEGANTAARFMDPNVATPDPSKPPFDPGLSGSVFPVLADDPVKGKSKFKPAPPGSAAPASATGQIGSMLSPDLDVQAAARRSNQDFSTPIPTPGVASTDSKTPESDRPVPTVTKVSDSGVVGRLLDVKDVVSAPFAGSRAPKSPEEIQSPGSPGKGNKVPSPGPGIAHVDQGTKASANSEGIRTTENPHTAHTSLAPPREDGTHVGGTGVVTRQTDTGGSDGKNVDGSAATSGITSGKETGTGTGETSGDLAHVPGVSVQGGEDGKIVAHEDGAIKPAENVHDTNEKEKEGKGVSRLWSKRRSSADGGRRGSLDDAGKSPTGSRRTKNTSGSASRFNEEPASSPKSEPASVPGSPSSSRIKVPFKDKIKGELKIISGKMSKNEAKVEQGIALKTGHAHDTATSPK